MFPYVLVLEAGYISCNPSTEIPVLLTSKL